MSVSTESPVSQKHLRPDASPILTVTDVHVEFPVAGGRTVQAVSGVSLDLLAGETLGVVGESGCGKSTLGRAIMQLPRPSKGSVSLGGVELSALTGKVMRRARAPMQLILQDPISSLNPLRRVRDIVAEGLKIAGLKRGPDMRRRVDEMLEAVGLPPDVYGDRKAHEFSGGQCQRISIARSVVLEPKVLICDEPVSALDVSVQAQVLNTLRKLKSKMNLAMIFISHDLSVVRNVSDRVAVMYLGRVCEVGAADAVYSNPLHPYTRALLQSIPGEKIMDDTSERDTLLAGELPSPLSPPSGCRFRTRCPRATEICAEQVPELAEMDGDHFVACHHVGRSELN